jgi:hypothetical protein
VIEEITGNQHEINPLINGPFYNGLEGTEKQGALFLALFRIAKTVTVQMDVRRMQNFNGLLAEMLHNASLPASFRDAHPSMTPGSAQKIKRLFVPLIVSGSLSLVKRDPLQEPRGSVVNRQTWYDTYNGNDGISIRTP